MKAYWMVGPTAIEQFESIDEAVEALDKAPDPIVFMLGNKTLTVEKNEVGIETDED